MPQEFNKTFQYKPGMLSTEDLYVFMLYMLERVVPEQKIKVTPQELDDFLNEMKDEEKGVRVLIPIKKDQMTGDVEFDNKGEVILERQEKLVVFSTKVPQKVVEAPVNASETGPQLVH